MSSERFLITGAFGCIGAWTVKRLVEEGVPVVTLDLPVRPHRLELIMEPDHLAQVTMLPGDVTDPVAVERAVAEQGITNIVHLAALVSPFVDADPVLGARVNVVGTAVVFEAARKHADHVTGVTYASSVAVYAPAAAYPPGPLGPDAPLGPATLYGVTKVANEEWARIYWHERGVRSVGLRPFFVYGPGRDQGVSATPTKAMVAAALGRPYHISFGGRAVFQHADDVAAAMVQASRAMPEGAPVVNLGGSRADMDEVVGAIERFAPEMAGRITHETSPLFTPEATDDSAVAAAIGPVRWRSLEDGVRGTMEHARAAARAGRLDVERAIG